MGYGILNMALVEECFARNHESNIDAIEDSKNRQKQKASINSRVYCATTSMTMEYTNSLQDQLPMRSGSHSTRFRTYEAYDST